MVIQIPRGKEDVKALEEFLAYWRELALEADSALGETHTDPEEAEIAAKAALRAFGWEWIWMTRTMR